MNALTALAPVAPETVHNPVETRLEIFDRFPAKHIAFAVHDHRCMPLVELGEVLVVTDTPRMYPEPGQWYLMQWISDRLNCETFGRDRVGQTIAVPHERSGRWGYAPPCSSGPGITYCGDGWWDWDRAVDLIRGKVVGIYRPGAVA